MLAATLVYAGTKKVETIRGTVAITLDGNDSTGFLKAFREVQISEMAGGPIVWEDRSWDKIIGSVIMPNLTDAGDSIANESETDSCIVNYKFVSSWFTITAEADTVTLPGTTFFVIDKDIWANYTESIYGDSTAATVKPTLTGDYAAFMMDQFYLEYYVSDTAGTSGALTGDLQYWFKFFEDD